MEQRRFSLFALALCCGLHTAMASGELLTTDRAQDTAPGVAISQAQQLETSGRYAEARDMYLSVIGQFDALNNEYSPTLISPLIGLGRTRVKLNDYPGAEEALRRAQHLIHRTEGVHALRQIEIIDLLTDLKLAVDEPFDADTQQQFALYIGQRNFGPESTELIPFQLRLATWYTESGQFHRARKTLEDVIDLIIKDGGENDPRLIEPLIQTAKVRRLEGSCCSYKILRTAEEVVLATPDLPNDGKAEVYEALGDAYLVDNKEEEADAAYARVWQLLGDEAANRRFSAPSQIALAKDLQRSSIVRKRIYTVDQFQLGFNSALSQPVTDEDRYLMESLPPQRFLVPMQTSDRNIHIADAYSHNDGIEPAQKVIGRPFQFVEKQLQQILPLGMQKESKIAQLFVEFELTVKSDGRTSDIELSGGNAPNRLVRLMRDVLYKATFRPRIVDGTPVTTEKFKLTQTFAR